MPVSDQELIDGYLKGRKKAFETIVQWIREVVNRKAWSEGISTEDIIADTTYKLLVNLRENRFKSESSLKTYTQKITQFTIIDVLRGRARIRALLTEQNLELSDQKNPHDLFEEQEQAMLFDRIFNLMDEKCKKLWRMIFHDMLSYKQVAAKLEIQETTVRTRLFKCKEEAIGIRARIA